MARQPRTNAQPKAPTGPVGTQPGTDQGEHGRFDDIHNGGEQIEDPALDPVELIEEPKLKEGEIPGSFKSEDILEPSTFSAWGPDGKMWFEGALSAMREGNRVRRRCWPAGVFCVIMPHLELPPHSTQEPGPRVNDRTAKFIGADTPLNSHPYFAAYIPNGNVWQPGWQPNVYDILGEDWEVMKEGKV